MESRPAKVALISEAPYRTTGFGITSRHIAQALHDAGHPVVCLAAWSFGQERFEGTDYPYDVWSGGWPLTRILPEFLRVERPDVLFFNFDVPHAAKAYQACRQAGWRGPIIALVLIDGMPAWRDDIQFLHDVRAIAPTAATANYLTGLGIRTVTVAPHGVDMSTFRPLPNRADLRKKAGLDGKFLVGVFGRNSERKQQPRVLIAMRQLRDHGAAQDIRLYLHCQPIDIAALGGWNLAEIVERLGIGDIVMFPEQGFSQVAGVPFASGAADADASFQAYGYIERINCCDLIVNCAFSGGFEMTTLEAQACGVPIAVTNDRGNMAEVMGDGGLLLDPVDTGIWKSGGRQHLVAAATIADVILRVNRDPIIRDAMVAQGLANAARYPWSRLTDAAVQTVRATT